MYKTFIYVIIIFVLNSCASYSPNNERIVNIIGEDIEIILSTDKEYIWGLFLNITGNVSGEIQLEIERCDSDYKNIYNYINNVNYKYSSSENTPADYYSSKIIIRIYPINNSKGELRIKYDFASNDY